MLQATPSMIMRVREETELLVHHLVTTTADKVSVRRMDHIHVEVRIPNECWDAYLEANKNNFIPEDLRLKDEKYIEEVIDLIKEHKYQLSPAIINYLELNKPVAMYQCSPDRGTVTVKYFDESRVFEIAKLFKGTQFDKEYIKSING